MDLYFLGTGAGMPSKQRNVTSIALRLYDERGTFWMFDCGEGTQHQVLHAPLKLSKLEKLFITHLHGDHLFGVPGLLSSRSNQGAEGLLTIYGPAGIRDWIELTISLSQSRLSYPLEIVEVQEGIVFQDERFTVEAALLDHRIDSYGYRVVEADQEGPLLVERLKELGVRPGPLFGKLKAGEDVVLEDGRVLTSREFVGKPIPGKVVAILGDTRRCEAAERLAQQADVLVHEATFGAELPHLAEAYYHATSLEAAQTAHVSGVKRLILTHISSRYQEEGHEQLLLDAKQVFGNTELAHDFSQFDI
ncbi:ribonuclease Z [Paenibacillus sp. y28]|uniref:ribonuclease Z n=1 Tax=Paenibacillus sp. y28 TaxID=3129110 RepID=UPI0030188674